MIIWFLILFFSLLNAEIPNLKILQSVYDVSHLDGIVIRVDFPELYEEPFLRGIPSDLNLSTIKGNKCAPHCYVPFRLPDPWLNIEYPRMPYVLELRDWYIDPHPLSCGALFNDKQKLLLRFNKYEVFGDIQKRRESIVAVDRAVHLMQKCAEGYYHFLIELVPRLLLVLDLIQKDSSLRILINSSPKKFMCEYFELLGIDPARVVFCDPCSFYYVSTLYFPRSPFMGYPSRQELFRTRDHLLKKLGLDNNAKEKEDDLIIIIHRPENARQVTNTKDLITAIKKEFPDKAEKIVVFDNGLSVKEQICLFNRARIIIGPHGAGLSNMLFSKPGAVVIELMPEKYFGVLYWHVASALSLKHHHVMIQGADKFDSFSCPIEKILELLYLELGRGARLVGTKKKTISQKVRNEKRKHQKRMK